MPQSHLPLRNGLMPFVHTCTLLEHHCIEQELPSHHPPAAELADLRRVVLDECTTRAHEWAQAEGVAIEVQPFERHNAYQVPTHWGVRWTVTVGRLPATAPEWCWSARWKDWLARFRRMDRPPLGVAGNPDGVIPFPKK